MTVEYLEEIAYKFRETLDYVVDKRLYGRLNIFANFPKACCRYSSDLLAEYMVAKGIPREHIQMVESVTKKEEYSHCWLMVDDCYYVDITADQFNGKKYFSKYEPIPICYVTSNTMEYLYDSFDWRRTEYIRNIGIDSYGGDIPIKLRALYDVIIQNINEGK